ncbi:MAG: aldehyde dehydrogenase family protein [Candidatus Marinamargulisbacteria bacterium]
MMPINNPNSGTKIPTITTPMASIDVAISGLASDTDWATTSIAKRRRYLKKFQKLLQKNHAPMAEAISYDIGKPYWESMTEVTASMAKVDATIAAFNYRLHYPHQVNADHTLQTVIKPIGCIAIIGPFNFPLHIPNGQIIPALLTGNRVMVKPSEYAHKTNALIEQLWIATFNDIESPIQFCYGGKITGEYLVKHPQIDAVFFTGSTATGRAIETAAQSSNKLCALEMGGNNALIAEDDSPHLISHIISSAFITSGQRCSCARRIIINQKISHIIPELIREIKKIRIAAYPSNDPPFMGPVVLPHIKNTLLNVTFNHSETALKSLNLGPGGLVSPRVEISNEAPDNEIFGPLIFISMAKSLEDAIHMANQTNYGLSASVYIQSKRRFLEAFHRIDAGIINWNAPTTGASGMAPFGGVKHSGNHRPGGFNMIDHCVVPVASRQQPRPSSIHLQKKDDKKPT